MPTAATITTYYTFAASTKARASQVNAMFSNLRGHHIPIDGSLAAAADGSYHLGSDEHRWGTGFVNEIDFETSTTTATLVLKGNTSVTAGSFLFQIEGVTKSEIGTSGFDGKYIKSSSVTLGSLAFTPGLRIRNFTANGTFTLPASASAIVMVAGCGGGGGGGGANGASAGHGGNGAPFSQITLSLTPGSEYAVVIGAKGDKGAGSGAGGPNAGSNGGISTFNGYVFSYGTGGPIGGGTTLTAANINAGEAMGGSAGQQGRYGHGGHAGGAAGQGGGGGGGGFGAGGAGGTAGVGADASANTGGGGGGGGTSGQTGGDGGSGQIQVMYFDNV